MGYNSSHNEGSEWKSWLYIVSKITSNASISRGLMINWTGSACAPRAINSMGPLILLEISYKDICNTYPPSLNTIFGQDFFNLHFWRCSFIPHWLQKNNDFMIMHLEADSVMIFYRYFGTGFLYHHHGKDVWYPL